MPIPATAKKFPMKALVVDKPRQPIKANDSVVKVVANAPMASAVGEPSWALIVMGTGMYCTLDGELEEPEDALAAWPPASFS